MTAATGITTAMAMSIMTTTMMATTMDVTSSGLGKTAVDY